MVCTTPLMNVGAWPSSLLLVTKKCLSVICLDKTKLRDHLDAMDSNLGSPQSMLMGYSFSVDNSALLDLFSPSVTVPNVNLPNLDLARSLASIQERLSPQDPLRPLEAESSSLDSGKQRGHCTAQPLFLVDPGSMYVGSRELPMLFKLGESSYFSREMTKETIPPSPCCQAPSPTELRTPLSLWSQEEGWSSSLPPVSTGLGCHWSAARAAAPCAVGGDTWPDSTLGVYS